MGKWLICLGIAALGLAGRASAQQGPVLLKDINTQAATPGTYNIDPNNFCSLNGITYFSGYSPNMGRQLWRTDGTSGGTYPITYTPDLNWSTDNSSEIPASLTAMNGQLYFFTVNKGASTTENSYNLMRSDVNGNITTLATSNKNAPSNFITLFMTNTSGGATRKKMMVYNNSMYFAFCDAQHGIELWKSDGTASGTGMLTDLISGTASALPANFAVANGYLFFTAANPTANNKLDLWRTDGTAGGTVKLRDSISVGGVVRSISVLHNKVYLLTYSSTLGKNYIWQSDGTVSGTSILDQQTGLGGPTMACMMTQGNNLIYQFSLSGTLTKYDGTTTTPLITGIQPFDLFNRVNTWADVNGTLYFSVRKGFPVYYSLWKTDGTVSGTVMVRDTISTFNYFNANGTLYFAGNDSSGNGMELWKSDGTRAGTVRLSNFSTNTALFNGDGVIDLSTDYAMALQGGKVLLSAFNGNSPYTGNYTSLLAVSDGTIAGTTPLTPIPNATYDSYPGARFVWNNALYFCAFDHQHGYEFWKTDGTPSGTIFMGDLNPGINSSYIQGFMPYNGKLYFCTSDTTGGHIYGALWSTDGTPAGTVKIKSAMGNSTYGFSKLDTLNGQLIIATVGGFYKSDGTAAGTVRIPTMATGATQESAIANYVFLNGTVIATAKTATSLFGADEVWKIDPAASTATRIATGQNLYQEMQLFDNAVYFVKERVLNQYNFALWKTDGTVGGTVVVDTNYLPQHLELQDNNTTLYYTTSSGAGNASYLRKITTGGTPQTVKAFTDNTLGSYAYNNFYFYYSFYAPQWTNPLYDNHLPLYPYFTRVKSGSPLFFAGGDNTTGIELMQTDGTTGGTSLVKDILAGTRSGNIQYLTHMLNKQGDSILVFVANDGVHGNELWVSDGTAAGTRSYTETMAGSNTMNPQQLVWLNNKLIFWGSKLETGNEPYVYELNQVLDAHGPARGNEPTLALYPNPAGSTVNVITVGETRVSLYNMAGSKLSEQQVPAGVNPIPVNNLAPGMYIIRAMDRNGKVLSARFVKQ